MKKILITGKSWYIATELRKRLSAKYEVTAIGREDFSLEDSVETDEFFNKSFYDVVIHSAIVGGSRIYPDNINCLKSNINIFLNILKNKKILASYLTLDQERNSHYNLSIMGWVKN